MIIRIFIIGMLLLIYSFSIQLSIVFDKLDLSHFSMV
jgi:hypothetical protein